MPTLVPYPDVLADMQRTGLRSLYYNSGAFGFPAGTQTQSVGWVGPPDETIRPAARPLVRPVGEPFVPSLVDRLTVAWQTLLAGPVWVMPKAHWAYELDFGSKAWLPDVLRLIGVDPDALAPHANGTAVVFSADESDGFKVLVTALLDQLTGSDFAAAWPGRRVSCTIHSHQQLWWTTDDAALFAGLDRLVPAP